MVGGLEQSVREHLASYLAGEEPLHDFQEWFAPRAWDVAREASLEAHELVQEINLSLAEFTSGHLTAVELAQRLRPLVESYRSIPSVQTASSAKSIRPAVAARSSASADIRLVAVPA